MDVRIPFDSLTLAAVTDELDATLIGGSVQHVWQPDPYDLVLAVRAGGQTRHLLLSCSARAARVHLTVVKRPNPPSAPAFCMLCRKHLVGARIEAAAQRGLDRVLDLQMNGPDGTPLVLTAELMGKHSNLILWVEDGAILDACKRIPQRLSRFREVLPGRPYVAPPAQEGRIDPRTAACADIAAVEEAWPPDAEARASRLMARFAGISPFLAAELAARAGRSGLAAAFEDVFGAARRHAWKPVLVRSEAGAAAGAYPLPLDSVPAARQHPRDTISTALDQYHSTAGPRGERDAAAAELRTQLERAIRSRRTHLSDLEAGIEQAGRASELREAGEILLASLHTVPAQAAGVTVPDLYDPAGGQRTIVLDPRLSARENAESYFRRYRKARDGAAALAQQREHTLRTIAELEQGVAALDLAQTAEAVRALREGLAASGALRAGSPAPAGGRRAEPEFEGQRIRVVRHASGYDILVGENEEANGYLLGRVAAPDDLWLHVRGTPSAHVVIRTGRNPNAVPPPVVQEAAVLAARHSAARHSAVVPVDVTLRKYVRRLRGAAPGAVTYQRERTVHVDPRR